MHPLFFSKIGDWIWIGLQAADGIPGTPPDPGAAAATMNKITMTPELARLALSVFLVGVVVTLLLGGGILILNYGLLSKRPEDRTGGRTPSDAGFLKNELWPEKPYSEHILPAEDEAEGVVPPSDETRKAG